MNNLKQKLTSAFIFLILFGTSAAAEDTATAILRKGPVPHLGIEFLDANAIPSYYGEYRYLGGTVLIYFTTEDIVLSNEWAAADCSIPGMLSRGGEDGGIVSVYKDRKGWTAFLSFEKEGTDICRFIESYRQRQNYFLNIAKDKSVFSFPAILDPGAN